MKIKELSDEEFKIIGTLDMLRKLQEYTDKEQNQKNNRKMSLARDIKNQILELKTIMTELKNLMQRQVLNG